MFSVGTSETVSKNRKENYGISELLSCPDIQFPPFQVFNCSCIGSAVNGAQAEAVKGYCDRGPGCKNFTYFLVISFALLLAVFLTGIPNKTVVLRYSNPSGGAKWKIGLSTSCSANILALKFLYFEQLFVF